jgi:phosphoserine phosphatase RsbU/P
VLGILSSIDYQEYRAALNYGDVLVIYSDGVTEATDPAGREFEIDGLAAAVIQSSAQPGATIVGEINKALVSFTAGAPPSDDITLIIARRVSI